jgi:hypothetical protein
MNQTFLKFLKFFLPLVLVFSVMAMTIYVAVQQDLRQSAYDPQIEIAEDLANYLADGKSPNIANSQVDISKSLAPFVSVFDGKEQPTFSTGTLNGKPPTVPEGVFAYAKAHSQDRITWQPQPGVRMATVVVYFKGQSEGYVIAGRSLREVENRTQIVMLDVAAGWAAGIAGSFALSFLFVIASKRFRIKAK